MSDITMRFGGKWKDTYESPRLHLNFESGETEKSYTVEGKGVLKRIVLEMPTFSGATVTGAVSVENSSSSQIYNKTGMVESQVHNRDTNVSLTDENTIKVTLSTDPLSSGTCYLRFYVEGGASTVYHNEKVNSLYHNDNDASMGLGDNVEIVQSGETVQDVIDSITTATADNLYTVIAPPNHADESYEHKAFVTVLRHKDQILQFMGKIHALGKMSFTRKELIDLSTTDGWYSTQGSSGGSFAAVDGMYKEFGLKVTTAAGATMQYAKTGSWDIKNKDIEIWFKFDDWTKVDRMRFYFWTGASKYFALYTPFAKTNKWQRRVINENEMSNDHFAVWETVIKMHLGADGVAGEVAEVTFGAIRTIEKFPLRMITLRFDDSYADTFTGARKILDKYNYPAVSSTITSNMGGAGSLSVQELQVLDANGWDICSHGHDSTLDISASTETELQNEFLRSRRKLQEWGITRGSRFFIIPGGALYEKTELQIDALKKNYLMIAHSGGQELNIIAGDAYNTKGQGIDGKSAATIKGYIDALIEHGGWQILYAHRVGDAGSLRITEAILEEVIDYIHEKNILVVTFSDVFDSFYGISGTPRDPWAESLVSKISVNTTLESSQQGTIEFDSGAGGITITLPSITTNCGLWYEFVKTNADATAGTLDGDGTETINGAATNTEMNAQWDSMKIQACDDGWRIIHKNIS